MPTDTTLVVERFRDELGDWRVVLHSPYGLRVHGPLALAVGRRLRDRYGIDEKPTASDDGIVVRLPDAADTEAPGGELFVFDADEIEPIVTAEVGVRHCSPAGSANARPGRCCCRAGTRAAARRYGSNASGPLNCSTSHANTPLFRSCSKPCANASRTSTTSPR